MHFLLVAHKCLNGKTWTKRNLFFGALCTLSLVNETIGLCLRDLGKVNNKILPSIANMYLWGNTHRVTSGTYKGSLKSKQTRCKYCPLRKRREGESTVSAPTCFWCSFHEVAICREHNCWERHLAEVTKNHNEGLDI
jgi:hypothetical protein